MEIMTSICCNTYNHENYIADAIESFLMQKTDFKYEILIHDDASKDRTAEIIKSYEEKYPNLVKPIYQTENQYSKGINLAFTYNYSRAKGKYIALCEGDDYWIDPHKLQKQVDYMESHPDCTFCFTNGKIVDVRGKQTERVFIPYLREDASYFDNKNRIYKVGELALLGFIPTASFFFRKNSLNNLPEFYYRRFFPGGDMRLKLIVASQGYAYYINDVTCVYRTNVSGSLMTQWKKYNREQAIQHNQSYIDLLELIDDHTNYEYSKEFDKVKMSFEFSKFVLMGDKQILKNERYRKYIQERGLKHKIELYISLYFPKVYTALKRIIERR
jgi:glycosyltransferase involved in cell wall biosynthesis